MQRMNHFNFPMIMMRNNNLYRFNRAIEEDDAESATRSVESDDDEPLERSYCIKRFSSNRKSISIFVVCRENVTNERFGAERLHALRRRLIVSVRARVAPICPLVVSHSMTYDFDDSVIQFVVQFEPSLSVALPVRQRQVAVFVNHGRKEEAITEDDYPIELWRHQNKR